MKKPNKLDYPISKSYRVISLLNCLRKMMKKIVVLILSNFCKEKELLYKGQFRYRKQRNITDVIVKLILITENVWSLGQQLETLFMNVKEAFDCIIK